MSGIVGVIAGPRGPLDRQLLSRMTESLVFRGPDRTGQWYSEAAGLGHTLLATTEEAWGEQQPLTFDGRFYLTADCRIDDRVNLRAALQREGRTGVDHADDAQLILHAFHAWGEDCVDHLLGDFAFALWDVTRQRLFCARDHSGVKPFYYSTAGGDFVCSNTLNTVRLHPGVSDRLDDLAVLDFLMIGENQELDTTIFADIQCLAPAHTLVWQEGRVSVRQYWERPIDEPIRYRRASDYVEHLNELLDTAIADRIRTPSIAVEMSGGLDSTLLAARAKRIGGSELKVSAFSIYYESLIPDQERSYVQIAADHIGIPVEYLCADRYRAFENGAALSEGQPEPALVPNAQLCMDFRRRIAQFGRVSFYGEGPDNLLKYEWRAYLRYLGENGSRLDRMRALVRSLMEDPRIPMAFSARRRVSGLPFRPPATPAHIQPEMVKRFGLEARWQAIWEGREGVHPYHPKGYESMASTAWQRLFNHADPGVNGVAVETRHPFLDVRVARYLLALPVIPWCRRKLIVRRAAMQVLPPAIWQREKAPLAGDPLASQLERGDLDPMAAVPAEAFAAYVTHWPTVESPSSWDTILGMIPVALGYWWEGQKRRTAERQ